MKPPSRTTRTTLSRSPSAALTCASRLMAQARAAFWPSSIETLAPSLPLATSLPSAPRQSWPETTSNVPVRTKADIIGDRRGGRRKHDAEFSQFRFDLRHEMLLSPCLVLPCATVVRPVIADRVATFKPDRYRSTSPLRRRSRDPMFQHMFRGQETHSDEIRRQDAPPPPFWPLPRCWPWARSPVPAQTQTDQARAASGDLRAQARQGPRQGLDRRTCAGASSTISPAAPARAMRSNSARSRSSTTARARSASAICAPTPGRTARPRAIASPRRTISTRSCSTRSTARPSAAPAASR